LWRNHETSDRTTEATTAVKKFVIVNPVTNFEVPHRRATLIKKADTPKVRIEIGKAINCNTGLISVLTIPMTIAAIKAV